MTDPSLQNEAPLADDPRRPLAFVESLVRDLEPVRPAAPWARTTFTWIAFASAWVLGALLLLAPLRSTALADLATPRLLAEAFFATGTLVAFAAAGLELAVPGAPRAARLLAPGFFFGAGWIAIIASGEILAGPGVTMEGKRLHCFIESLTVGTVPAIVGVLLARRRAIAPGPLPGALVGMAAGALPAFAMQLACMVDPDHALQFHYPPVLVLGAGAALLATALRTRD